MLLPAAVILALLCRVLHDLWLPNAVPADGDRALMMLAMLALGHVVLFEIVALLRSLWRPRTRRSAGAYRRFVLATMLLEAMLPALCYGLLVFVGNWPVFVRFELETSSLALHEILVVLPIVFFLMLGLLSELRLGESAERSSFRLRMGSFLLVFYIGLYAWFDLARWHPVSRAAFDHLPVVHWGLLALGIAVGVMVLPVLLGAALGIEPLRSRALAGELLDLARRMRVRPGRLCQLDTGRRLLNAFVVGPFAWSRRVVFTDELLHLLSGSQLLAVYGHELAHVRGHHFLRLLAFGVLLPLAVYGAFLPEDLGELEEALFFLGCMAVFLPLLLRMHRRFEHEADLMSAEALGDPGLVIETLESVVPGSHGRHRGSLFHPSVARRVELLRVAQERPEELRSWWRQQRRVQGALLLVLGVASGSLVSRGLESWRLDHARFLLGSGRLDRATEIWQERVRGVAVAETDPASSEQEPRLPGPSAEFQPDAIERGAWELIATGHAVPPGGVWHSPAPEAATEPAPEDSETPRPIEPFEIDEYEPGPWERLGAQILRARRLVTAGDPSGAALVPLLHRRALRRAARSLESGDREAGRQWMRLAATYDDLTERESALLLWLEAWRSGDDREQRRAAAILERAGGSPSLDPVVHSLLRG